MDFRFGYHEVGGVRLHYAEAGDPAKPLLVCLHGFPEYWAGWRAVMAELAGDFHVVAPDQRGYNLSDKPQGLEPYGARRLAADIASLADSLSPDRPFALAGHDWGASVAYACAFANPRRISHLIIANGVHPVCFQRALFEVEGQRAASQYIPWLKSAEAEALLSEDGYRRLLYMIEGFSKTSFMTKEMRDGYIEAWSQPGALTGMLNWYRASLIVVPAPGEKAAGSPILEMPEEAFRVRMPHLVLWGEEDQALLPVCFDGLDRFAPDLTVERFAGASHWILHEKPKEAAAAIRGFLAAG